MTTTSLPPTPLDVLRSVWRRLRTMRTAIILLLVLGAGASIGSLFPQRPVSPAAVRAWIASNPDWAPVAERLGLFDVYGSWWFMAIYALLLVSLVGCLLPRYRAFAKAVRARPRPGGVLSSQQRYRSGVVASDATTVLDAAERVMRARRFRVARNEAEVASEKGHIREGGSLVFHTAFLILLLGMSVGKWFGFDGQVARVEGDGFTDTHVEYDSIIEGRFFNERHLGFSVDVERFDVAWHPNRVPKHFVSTVSLYDENGTFVRRADVEVNHPLTYRGVKIYQLSWGWAPIVEVRQNGELLYGQPTVFLPRNGLWRGVAKVPQTAPEETGLEMFFFTDPEIAANGFPFDRSPEPRNPTLIAQVYRGDLRLVYPQSVYELDDAELEPQGSPVVLRSGDSVDLADGIELRFTGLKRYTVLQVSRNPGAPVLAAGAILIMVGLVPALYGSRRRVWIRVEPAGDHTRLEIAGHALQRKAAFEDEFTAIVAALDRELAGSSAARAPDTIGARDG